MSLPPNIILIYADDLGRGLLSCYGQRHFQTPHIDRLARDGMRFTNAYSCAFCAPARASLLTGRHDCHRGGFTYTVGGIYHAITQGRLGLEALTELIQTTSLAPRPDEVFLAEIARAAGYVTAEIGKLEWGFATTPQEMARHGWDYHYGYYDHAQCHGFYPPYVFEQGRRVDVAGNTRADFGVTPRSESPENRERRWDRRGCAVYSQDLFDAKIVDFLRANRDRPFFLYHPSQLPHGPIAIPEIHPAVRDLAALTDYEKEYASMVLRLDETVGLILDELERLGIDDRTAIVFASDNGHQPYYVQPGRCDPEVNLRTGERYDNITTRFTSELSGDVFNGNDGMAGLKFSNWDGGLRVPWLVRWPGQVAPGSTTDRLTAVYDLFATVADLVGQPVPPEIDGRSFLPTLRGNAGADNGHEFVVFASGLGPALVTRDGWKLRHVRRPKLNAYQLYHLPDDRREDRNLVADAPDVTRRLSVELLRACEGNFLNGMPESHQVYLPGLHFYGPECHWDLLPA